MNRASMALTLRPNDGPGRDTGDEPSKVATAVFAKAVAACGKGTAVASLLGCSEEWVSAMRTGKKSVSMQTLIALAQRDRGAAAVIAVELCAIAGLEVRDKVRVDKEQVKKRALHRLRSLAPLWEMTKQQIARDLGASEDDVEWALDAPTGEIQLNPAVASL